MNSYIRQHQTTLEKICRSLSVEKLYIFGSGANDSLGDESDLDFLVIFRENVTAQDYAESYFSLHEKLSGLFNRKIDLITKRSLSNPYFTEGVNNSKKLIYSERDQKVSV